MKKTAILLMMVAFMCIFTVTTAFATTTEQEIENIAKVDNRIKEAKAICYENICVVAVQKQNFTSKTEYAQYKANTTSKITETFSDITNVFVTASPRVMFEINRLKSLGEDAKEQAIKHFIEMIKEHRDDLPRLPKDLVQM